MREGAAGSNEDRHWKEFDRRRVIGNLMLHEEGGQEDFMRAIVKAVGHEKAQSFAMEEWAEVYIQVAVCLLSHPGAWRHG